MNKWTQRYLEMAESVSTWSKDPSTKVGGVIVGAHGQILSQGYNGFPRGFPDTPELLNNREEKYKFVIHAEKNCIYNAGLTGISLLGSHIYIHGLPVCGECSKGLAQVGIKKAIMRHPREIPEKWTESYYDVTIPVFKKAGIQFIRFDENWKVIND